MVKYFYVLFDGDCLSRLAQLNRTGGEYRRQQRALTVRKLLLQLLISPLSYQCVLQKFVRNGAENEGRAPFLQ
jgi:hypothetical protein